MVLDSLNSETPNIKDLSTEISGSDRLPFNVEREIPPKERKKILEWIQWYRLDDQKTPIYLESLYLANDYIILFPETDTDQFILNYNRLWIDLKEESDLQKIKILSDLKTFPVAEIDRQIETYRPVIDKQVEQSQHLVNKGDFMDAVDLIILDPSVKDKYDLSPVSFELLEQHIKHCDYRLVLNNYIELLVAGKVLFPDYYDQLEKWIDWPFLKEKFNEYNDKYLSDENNLTSLMWLASNLKVIAAKKVEVTDTGLKLDMGSNEQISEPTPPLPETRNF